MLGNIHGLSAILHPALQSAQEANAVDAFDASDIAKPQTEAAAKHAARLAIALLQHHWPFPPARADTTTHAIEIPDEFPIFSVDTIKTRKRPLYPFYKRVLGAAVRATSNMASLIKSHYAPTLFLGNFADLDLQPQIHKNPDQADQESFHFILSGIAAHGNTIAVGNAAKLSFKYTVPRPPMRSPSSTVTRSTKQEPPRSTSCSLQPRAADWRSPAGSLEKPVSPRENCANRWSSICTPRRHRTTAHSTLHIDFQVRGESVHQTEIKINLIAAEKSAIDGGATKALAPPPPNLLALPATLARPQAQKIVLSLSFAVPASAAML